MKLCGGRLKYAYRHYRKDEKKMILVKLLILVILFIIIGALVVKLFHPDYSMRLLGESLKNGVMDFIEGLFSKKRTGFDSTLVDDLKMIVKPYSKAGFDIELRNYMMGNVLPTISIKFVPEREYVQEEIIEIMHLVKIKFREYLACYDFQWKTFTSYSCGDDYLNIYIHYAEFKTDNKHFKNYYRKMVRNKIGKTGVALRDMELEAELRNVN